jgi:hypothetical protein
MNNTLIKVINIREGLPIFDRPLKEILDQCVPGGALQVLNPKDYISYQQIRWWKGILLPALSKDQGETVGWWETRLKLEVMPDEFAPVIIKIQGHNHEVIPSITKLSIKKMNQLIEGSVDKCREWGLEWVTLPATELRKET